MKTRCELKYFLLLTATVLASFAVACAQTIRIVVVEAKHGKPVADECLNISLGAWHGADLLVGTDKNGVATLVLASKEASALLVPGRVCSGMATTKPVRKPQAIDHISLLPDWYVSCQYSSKVVKDPAWSAATPAERIPSFAVADIIANGIAATNSCSKLVVSPKPGELWLIVRKRTFLEGMRS